MTSLLHILDQGDGCALFTVVVVLLLVGSRLSDPSQQRWGAGLGVTAFLAYGAHAWGAFGTAEALLDVTLRALAAGGLTMGLAWMALPVAQFLYGRVVVLPGEKSRAWAQAAWRRREERRLAREQDMARRRRAAEDVRLAPQRERARAEAEAAACRRADAQRRREEARAACEVLYALHAADVAQRFGKEAFDDFVKRHLGDDRPPETVEQRAQQLRQVIERHAEKANPSHKTQSVADAMADYREEVERIRAAKLDPEWEGTLLLKLKGQLFERLIRRTEES